jgi:two-component system C4-dicarboxylate transport response regulator DctD
MAITPAARPDPQPSIMSYPDDAAPRIPSARILVVEDVDGVRDVPVRALHEAGFDAVGAVDGPAALALLEATPPGWFALLLTDSVMPSMTGAELIRRALERDPGQRALHMTGHPNVQFDAEAGVPGHVPVIRKPFSAEQLLEAVRAALAAPPSTAA